MDQEKVGKFIKELRKKNNLTQADLANKYGVTYQAVSKWENGRNLPDMSLIMQMSKDFNVNVEDFLGGEIKEKKDSHFNKIIIVLVLLLIIIVVLLLIVFYKMNNSFEFKTISSSSDQFSISGSLSYNKEKSAIYISNIDYLGEDDSLYKSIECLLFENDGVTDVKISTFNSSGETDILLDDFLEDVTFSVDDYQKICKDYSKDSLYILINAIDFDDKTISYKVPLSIESGCLK